MEDPPNIPLPGRYWPARMPTGPTVGWLSNNGLGLCLP